MLTITTTQTFVADTDPGVFASGLTGTIGVRIRDDQGNDTLARTTSGIVEDIEGSGIYRKTFAAVPIVGQYTIVWDDGSGNYATEDLVVVYVAPPPSPGTGLTYITVEALKETLSIGGETYADADITSAIIAASKGIDKLCKRKGTTERLAFGVDATDQVRYYTPVDLHRLDIDDVASFTLLETDPSGDGSWPNSWTPNSDFVLEPLNAATEGWPYTRLRVHPNGRYVFPCSYPRSVRVTGKFGWPAVPGDISEAMTMLSVRLLKRAREVPFGVVGVSLDGVAVRIAKSDPDIQLVVSDYIKHRVSVG